MRMQSRFRNSEVSVGDGRRCAGRSSGVGRREERALSRSLERSGGGWERK